MAKAEIVTIPRGKFERIISEARRTSAEMDERIRELKRQRLEMEERHREDRRRSY